MTLFIERAGHSSIQDAGRLGYERIGVSAAGAVDRLSLARSNALADLPPDAAAIEIGPLPFAISVRTANTVIAVCGASRRLTLNGQPSPFAESFEVVPGDSLELSPALDGMYSYLSVKGGLCVEKQLGSASPDVRAGLGRPFARPLANGDEIPIGTSIATTPRLRKLRKSTINRQPIRVVLGPQSNAFTSTAIEKFLTTAWVVSTQADRTAYRLLGPKLKHACGHDIVSEAVVPGSIQVPGSGQPIILMPDCGTTGGYPKIATIIEPDLGRIAQARFQDTVRFKAIGIEAAEHLSREFLDVLENIPMTKAAEHDVGSENFIAALASANVAGDAVDATSEVP